MLLSKQILAQEKLNLQEMKKVETSLGGKTCEPITIDKDKFDRHKSSPYTLDSARLYDNCFLLYVQYKGGCGTTKFDMITANEPKHGEIIIDLQFNDQDRCLDVIHKKLSYNFEQFEPFAPKGKLVVRLFGTRFRETYTFPTKL